jgi:hypothetical protein
MRSTIKAICAAAACFAAFASSAQSNRDAVAAAIAAGPAIWAAHPVGPQSLPDMAPIDLIEPIGDYPLADGTRGCLLVARRDNRIIAVELTPLMNGPKIVGWTPSVIDNDTLVSRWHYQAPEWTQQSTFANPATDQMAASSSSITASSAVAGIARNQSVTSSSAKTWSQRGKDASGKDTAHMASSTTVTINGKVYSRYTNFESASTDVPATSLDDYLCQR